jgi:hypothetical protein
MISLKVMVAVLTVVALVEFFMLLECRARRRLEQRRRAFAERQGRSARAA